MKNQPVLFAMPLPLGIDLKQFPHFIERYPLPEKAKTGAFTGSGQREAGSANMIDIHNHIIPAIDDGPDTLEKALELLAMAEADGIQRLVCTPHMHPGRYENDITTIAPAFDSLVGHAREAGLGIELAMAAEVRF